MQLEKHSPCNDTLLENASKCVTACIHVNLPKNFTVKRVALQELMSAYDHTRVRQKRFSATFRFRHCRVRADEDIAGD